VGQNIVWSRGFGFADIENHVTAKPDTAYRTASIGKAMTATAAMRLVEQDKLNLNAPIQKYCPAYPVKDESITVRDLISHTSGIRHFEGPTAEAEGYITRHYDHVSDALEIFRNDPLVQKPGADFHYTTWGYVVLGCVIEGASGEEYRRFMQETIFQPAGMTATRDDDPRVIIPKRAKGYVIEGGVLKNARWADMSAEMAAGGFITTAPDLVRFMLAWMKGDLVANETKAQMLAPYILPNKGGTVDHFGLGWFFDDYHGLKSAFYGGSTAQVSGFIFFVPEKEVAVAFLFNLEDVSGSERSKLARDITDVVLRYRPALRRVPSVRN
jgi:CubicO group peptidase (beta-lactamase class C family)